MLNSSKRNLHTPGPWVIIKAWEKRDEIRKAIYLWKPSATELVHAMERARKLGANKVIAYVDDHEYEEIARRRRSGI